MDFNGNFSRIDAYPTEALRAQVEALTIEDWLRDPWRQNVYKVHRESNGILLMFDKDYRHENPTKHPNHDLFAKDMERIYARLLQHFGVGYPIRALFARLPAGAKVYPHPDAGFSLTNAHRCHLPVLTNPEAYFTIGGETKVVPYGELWEINNVRVHDVHNAGKTDRIHLLVDWVIPGEYRFFRPNDPAFVTHFRFAPGAKIDTPLHHPGMVRAISDNSDPVELELTRELEPLVHWLRVQKNAPFTQRDVPLGTQSTMFVNNILDTLVCADFLQHSFVPFA